MYRVIWVLVLCLLLDACSPAKEEEAQEAIPQEVGRENKQNPETVKPKTITDTTSKVSNTELQELKNNLKK